MGEDHERRKRHLRREISAACRGLEAGVAVRLAAEVCRRVTTVPGLTAARHLVAYAPLSREVDPAALVRDRRAAGATVYYPRIGDRGLEFLAAEGAALVPGPRGVLEPPGGVPLAVGAPDIVILVPGVAFDSHGARLGRGLGCYDRALAHHPTALRIGLAYDIQIVPAVPEAVWDERMDFVATETRLIAGEPRPGRVAKEIPQWN